MGPLAAAAWVGLHAVAAGAAPPAAGERPDVLLVTIDTLRADHLGAYGHPDVTTPFIDRLARSGRLHERCYSTSSWTAPALASLLTSHHPTRHGITQGFARDKQVWSQPVLGDGAVVLPELLSAEGYLTLGITANAHLEERLGFAQGFDAYACLGFSTAAAVERRVLRMAKPLSGPQPWFLWVHYFDPHTPYEGIEPWLTSFYPAGERFGELRQGRLTPSVVRPPEKRAFLDALYKADVGTIDHRLAALLARLPRLRDAALVLTADHGEELLDHGDFGHGNNLFDESVRVPLIVRAPSVPRGLESGAVSLIDVAPTILHIAGGDASKLEGRVLDGTAERAERRILSELSRGKELRALMVGPWKLIVTPGARLGSLYRIDEDPGEGKPIAGDHPAILRKLRADLAAITAEDEAAKTETGTSEASEETRRQLEAVGYVQ